MRLLTLARDLTRRKAREREGLFVVEGIRVVEELLRSPLETVGVLAAPKLAESARGLALREAVRGRGVELADVSDREFGSAAETESPQGVLAIARVPHRRLAAFTGVTPLRLLVLDAVQDPGNVGTMLRTAAALGANGAVALPGTVDLWNAKVVRSAMGAHFHHPAFHCTWAELQAFLTDDGVTLFAADAEGEDPPPVAPRRLALALGNEGSGLSPEVRQAASAVVALRITPIVESLNVAVAAGILLHQFRA
jgi:TrmH family RNA methyltransferase